MSAYSVRLTDAQGNELLRGKASDGSHYDWDALLEAVEASDLPRDQPVVVWTEEGHERHRGTVASLLRA